MNHLRQFLDAVYHVVGSCVLELFACGVAIAHSARPHSCTDAHHYVYRHVAHHDGLFCGDAHGREDHLHRLGVGLRTSDVVAADGIGHILTDAQLLEQFVERTGVARCGYCNGYPLLLESVERLPYTVEQRRGYQPLVFVKASVVDVGTLLQFVVAELRAQCAEAVRQRQSYRCSARLLVGDGLAQFAERLLLSADNCAARVGKGAVEIEYCKSDALI